MNAGTEFTVGQTVHCLASPNVRRYRDDPWTTETVTKVARKYVYADNGRGLETRYHKDTGIEATEYIGSATRIFTDEGKAAFVAAQEVDEGLRRHKVYDLRGFSHETRAAVLALLDADVAARSGGDDS